MIGRVNFRMMDIALFTVGNLVNLLLVGIFLARTRGLKQVESVLGIIVVAMALPLIGAVILNGLGGREWWTVVLPLPLIVFCAIELLFDYILELEFRNTALLWPYLLFFYLGLIGMVGYSFSVGKVHGFVTLATYFLNLLATWYAHSKGVG